MIRLAIVVEGRTEQQFVRLLLAGHLIHYDVLTEPMLIGESAEAGGDVTIERLTRRMAQMSYHFDAVTSLVDFYGFRRRTTDDVDELERLIDEAYGRAPHRRLREDRVFAYVQMHEFEALLFSDVRALGRATAAAPDAERALAEVRDQFGSPEEINDRSDTAPSKRITNAMPNYDKVLGGSLAAEAVGLDAMRGECPRFGSWLTRLEVLGVDD